MRTVTPTEARKNFFDILDKAARGEVIVIKRRGIAIELIRSRGHRMGRYKKPLPKYDQLIKGSIDHADQWGWDWSPERGLESRSGR